MNVLLRRIRGEERGQKPGRAERSIAEGFGFNSTPVAAGLSAAECRIRAPKIRRGMRSGVDSAELLPLIVIRLWLTDEHTALIASERTGFVQGGFELLPGAMQAHFDVCKGKLEKVGNLVGGQSVSIVK